jgi:hypothetical protein
MNSLGTLADLLFKYMGYALRGTILGGDTRGSAGKPQEHHAVDKLSGIDQFRET